MEPWPKPVQPDLLVLDFIRFCRFYVSLGDIQCCPIYFISHLVTFPYLIIPWVFSVWYHLLCIYLLLHAYAHDTVFNAWLWFGFIDTLMLISARHLAFASPLAGGVLTPLDPHVQVLELGARGFSWLLTWEVQRQLGSPADHLKLYPSSPPCAPLEFSLCKLVSAFCTVHSCTSFCMLAFAPIRWCNIIVILCHIWW